MNISIVFRSLLAQYCTFCYKKKKRVLIRPRNDQIHCGVQLNSLSNYVLEHLISLEISLANEINNNATKSEPCGNCGNNLLVRLVSFYSKILLSIQ